MMNEIQTTDTASARDNSGLEARLMAEIAKLRDEQNARLDALDKRAPEDVVTIIVFSGDLDKVMAGFVIATGALAMGMQVSMFFTFWGLTAIKKDTTLKGKGFKQKMLAMMNPKNSEKMGISRLNMLGMGPAMMKMIMKEKNVSSVEELRQMAVDMDVKMTGCQMSMDVMGVDASELIDGVEFAGVAAMLEDSLRSRTTIFV